jgi:methyl-accepting chemotaxis protein
VADEVRKLAEESNTASRRVAEMMESLDSGTKSAIASSQESAEVISRIVDKAHDIQTRLDNALKQIGKVNDSMQTIAAAAQEQAASSNEISESAVQAQGNIENVASEISAITKATGETQGAIERVASEAASLSSISSELEGLVAKFTIDEKRERVATLRAAAR